MENLIIDSIYEIPGKYTITKDNENETITGMLVLDKYIEKIETLEDNKLFLIGIDILSIAIGSEDNEVIYTITANKIKPKKGFGL